MVMRRKAGKSLLVLGVLAVAACGAGAPESASESSSDVTPPASIEADLAAIEDFNRRYVRAINEGEIDALAALTTDNHIMLTPGRPPIMGKQALVESMERVFDQSEIDETWTPEETVVSGDLAYQRGTYTVGSRPHGSDEAMRRTRGSFLRIYRRQPDGEWLMIRDTFNAYEMPEQD